MKLDLLILVKKHKKGFNLNDFRKFYITENGHMNKKDLILQYFRNIISKLR